MSYSREILNLKPGDHVTARVKFLTVGVPRGSRGEYHIWELKRDGVTIQSYQDAYLYQTRVNEQQTTYALWLGLVSAICLMVALALRMHFGEWVDSTPLVPADAIGAAQEATRLPHYQPLSSADYPRTYYMSQGREALTLLVGVGMIGLGIFRVWSATADVSSMLFGIFLIIFGIFAICATSSIVSSCLRTALKFTTWPLPKCCGVTRLWAGAWRGLDVAKPYGCFRKTGSGHWKYRLS